MSESVTPQQIQWLDAYCNGTITESEFAKFHIAMEESSDFRRFARQYLGLDSLLHEADITILPMEQPAQLTPKFSRTNWLAVSAAVFLLGLGLGSLFFTGSGKQQTSQENAAATSLNENSVARLVNVSNDAAFHPDCKLPTDEGSLLGKGWIQLDQGSVTILFNSGAKVGLTGPAVFGIDTPMRSYLEYGTVEVNAPESARDFVVATDSIEVVDLGTKFTLSVDSESGESDLLVTEGLVDLRLGSRGTKRQIQPVEAGYAARVDASGAIVSLEESDRNIDSAPGPELLAHWSFNELNDGGIVGDSVSQMNGRCMPESLDSLVDENGRRSIDLSLDGSVDLNKHAKRFGESDSCSFAFWLRNPRDGAAVLFSLSDGSERNRVQLHLNRRHLVYGWQSGELYDAISGRAGEWESDRWYHVVATLGEGVLRLYRDGVPIASGSYGSKIGTPLLAPAAVANLSHARIGRLSSGTEDGNRTSQWFGGQIDDFQFYSNTLSEKRIRELFEQPDRKPETE